MAVYGGLSKARAEQGRSGLPVLPGPTQGGIYQPGIRNLFDLLNNPGQTDQYSLKKQLASSSRDSANRLASTQGRFARQGQGGGSLAKAMQESIKNAGLNNAARITNEDARAREGLRRDDSNLLDQYVQRPSLELYGADKGISLANAQSAKQQKQSAYAAGAALIGTLAASFCDTADELYGRGSDESILARLYMNKHADDETYDEYSKESKNLASRIRKDKDLRAEVKPIFDSFVKRAKADYPGRF